MKVLFVSSGNSNYFEIAPFIKGQGESLVKQGINVKYFQIKGKGVIGYIGNIVRLQKYITKQKFDVIHAHYSLTAWVVFFAAPFNNRVISLMGSDVHSSGIKGFIKRTFMGLQVFTIQALYKKIIVKSENLSSLIWRRNIHIIPNGVNYRLFKPLNKMESRKTLGLPIEPRIILFLANTEDYNKNYSLLKESISLLQTDNIELITPYPVPHEKIPLYLNACDILVVTSLEEGSPNVIKEALACNTRIVSTPCGDVPLQTEGLRNVFLCDYNSNSLADSIDTLLTQNVKENSREIVRNKIDEEVIVDKLINLYKS